MQIKDWHAVLDECHLSLNDDSHTEKELQTMKPICVIPPFSYILHTQMIF